MKKTMVEIKGERYITPKPAADCWGMSQQAVTSACRDGRILGAFQDTRGKWLVPANACKPMEREDIRRILILSLALKNRPDQVINNNSFDQMVTVYRYLRDTGYIEDFDEKSERIPFEVVLTEKGMTTAISGKKINFDIFNAGTTLIQLIASVITIFQAVLG